LIDAEKVAAITLAVCYENAAGGGKGVCRAVGADSTTLVGVRSKRECDEIALAKGAHWTHSAFIFVVETEARLACRKKRSPEGVYVPGEGREGGEVLRLEIGGTSGILNTEVSQLRVNFVDVHAHGGVCRDEWVQQLCV